MLETGRAPISTVPRSRPEISLSSWRAASISARTRWARLSNTAPASVSSTSRVVRRKSSSPSSASSRLICWETAGWATDSARLARVNWP